MNRRKDLLRRSLGAVLVLLLMLPALPSCTHGRPGANEGSVTRYGLKKKVLLIPIVDLADVGQEAAGRIHSQLLDLLNRAPGLIVQEGEEGLLPPLAPLLPVLIGSMTNEGLIKACEDRGVHALVACILNPVETETTRKGFWPFRYTAKQWEISILLNVVEIYSGTLALSLLDAEKVYRTASEDQGEDTKTPAEGLSEAIPAILKRQKSQVLRGLADIRWYAPIRSVDGETLTFTAGQELGIRPHQSFPVFARGEEVRIRDGRTLALCSKKIGEVKITEVSETRSTAVGVSGGPFSTGQCIMDVR